MFLFLFWLCFPVIFYWDFETKYSILLWRINFSMFCRMCLKTWTITINNVELRQLSGLIIPDTWGTEAGRQYVQGWSEFNVLMPSMGTTMRPCLKIKSKKARDNMREFVCGRRSEPIPGNQNQDPFWSSLVSNLLTQRFKHFPLASIKNLEFVSCFCFCF